MTQLGVKKVCAITLTDGNFKAAYWINKKVAALAKIAKYRIIRRSYFVINIKFSFNISPNEKRNDMSNAAIIIPNVNINGGSL